MGLSRLENFLRSFKGNIIYVDPNALDSTDSIENDGTSAARPLKTIQRALIEAARFSHLPGLNNDKFANTTILIYPGEHLIDNRPGWIPVVDENDSTAAAALLRSGIPLPSSTLPFSPFDASTNFDITSDTNVLYKFNSVYGGVIIPRGTSIVGMDLRKTKIRPKYIPDPKDDDIDRSAIFRLTGSCYLWQFSIFDGNPNGQVFSNYGQSKTVPNFSHHKLTVFEYADGVNNVEINDRYIQKSYTSTDLDMYYQKIGLAYGPPAREIKNDFPSQNIDIQAKLDEFRIVGSRGFEVNISQISSGDGNTASTVAKVVLESPISELDVDTAIRIDGVREPEYNGQFVVKSVINATTIEYNLSTTPSSAQGGTTGTLNLVVDTVSSASPYIFNCSLRSVYGMCGLHADGSKADGFKSMVVAQYTGISLQKDNNAFIKYNQQTASYNSINVENIATDSLARYKPEYQNYHIKASNNAFIQCVSVFAIGFSQHFLSESGGDQSITNSNSNFGATALSASGYQDSAFLRDDVGYITHIIPPREIEGQSISVEYDQIDIPLSRSVNPNKIYFYNRTDLFNPPKSVIDGYRIGAKINDKLNVVISGIATSADIIMQPNPNYTGTQAVSYQKTSLVQRNGSTNTISSNIITLDSQHNFINGESVRVISKNGNLPEGIVPGRIYYVITSSQDQSLTNSTIKLASSLNDALNAVEIAIYNNTPSSQLTIVSRVSDKKCGDIGHPIQFYSDEVGDPRTQWYINVNPLTNNIYNAISPLPVTEISTARTFLTRILSNRVSEDSIYKFRYVIPKDSSLRARPPSEGYVIQESSSTITGEDQITTQFSIITKNLSDLYGPTELRNLRLISDASWSSDIATINTEIPHNLSVGSKVEIENISSSSDGTLTGVGNTTGIGNSGFNGIFNVTSLPSSKSFRYSLPTNPGIFVDTTSTRSKSSPHYTRKNLPGTYLVYRSDKIQEYIQGKQDGVYHLIVTNSSNSPDVQPFTEYKFSQPIQNLYPQVDRDNPKSDPNASICYASRSTIGEVIINDPENSITKETLDVCFKDYRIDFGLSDIRSTTGIAHSLFTSIDHGLNPVTTLNITSPGSNYGYGDTTLPDQTLYNANLLPTNSRGEGATAVIQINSSGSLIDIKIMSGGSNYAVNDVLTVVGVATTAGWVPATVTVSSIYNHIGETLQITGTDIDSYNQLYNITGITSSRVLQVDSSSIINPPTLILGSTRVANSNVSLTGNSFLVTHTASVGVTTCTTSDGRSHGLQVGDKITFRRGDTVNLGNYIVRTVVSLTSFTIGQNIGNGTSRVLPYKYSSTGGLISRSTESESARLVANYAGITTTLSDPVGVNNPQIVVPNPINTGIKIGDYLEIDNEIVKVRQTVVKDIPLIVFRGVLGTKKDTHEIGAVIRKISPIPIELRRNSILRASGHTFEYLGYGSGNYSTAFPDRQDRQLSTQEELLSQSFKSDGGSSIFTGMNSDGDFYVGNKRVSSATGREEVFDSPIPTSRGEEITDETSLDITTTSELNVSRRIRVDGGQENNIISEFGGPTIFNEKVTVNNDIESNSIYLQGDLLISNKYTVSYQEPIIIGTPGDITYYSKPTQDGGYAGWMYTIENQWRAFGPIQNELDRYVGIWSGRIIPFAGTGDNGIVWDSNPGGGTGDFAFIQYYVQSGENTRLHIGIRNDADDDIYLEATETYTSSNLTVLSTVDSTDKNTGALIVEGGVGIEKNLTADSININTSGITQGNLGSNGGIDGIFEILNTTDSGTTVFQNKDSVGNYNDILTLANSSATIDGNLTVTENGSVKFNNVTESLDKDTGSLVVEGGVGIEKNTNIGGTLGVTGATTLSSTLGVTGNTTLNNNVTLVGSDIVAAEYFKIQNGSAVDKFTVDSFSGNTSISGTLDVTGNTTLNNNVTLVGSDTLATEYFKIQNGSAFDKFTVDSFSGNTSISGTLGVTGATTLNNNVTLVGSDTLATEYFKIQNGSAVDKFTVDSFSGNTSISGTLDVTGATTLSSTLGVTGQSTASSFVANGGGSDITINSGGEGSIELYRNGGTGSYIDFKRNLLEDYNVRLDNFTDGVLKLTGNLNVAGNSTLGDASTDILTVNATSTFNAPVTLAPSQNLTVGGDLTVSGDLTVNGTTTIIESTIVTVVDKNIELGSTVAPAVPDNDTANGGGIILKGTTDKTLIWDSINFAWTSSEHFNLASGKEYRIDNTAVIDSNRNILNIVNHTMTGDITVNTDKFTVDGTTGNTVIGGTLGVTGTTTFSGSFGVTGDTTITNGDLYITRTDSTSGDILVNGGTDGIFGLFNTTNDGRITFNTKDSGGVYNDILDLISTQATIDGNLSVTGTATVDSNIILSNPNTSLSWAIANSDYAFIRFNSTSDSAPPSQLEIAIGDNGDSTNGTCDSIVVNQYGTGGSISRTLSLLDSSGNTGVPGDLNLSGSLNINTSRFNVNGITGNTTIGGALNVTSTSGVTAARFVKNGATTTNFLKAGGADAALTGAEVIAALNYIPANSANASGPGLFAQGNSAVCEQLSDLRGVPRSFNGGNTDFTLRIGTDEFIPVGSAANLIVSLGGVIQRPGTDFTILQSPPGTNTSTISFTTAPPAGINHFIVALGGQGSLTSNVSWTAKGDIPVAISDNNAILVNVGADNTVLTADSTATSGVAWKTISNGVTPIGGIIMWSGTVIEAQALVGWAICDGNNGTPNLTNRFIVASHNGFGSGTVPIAGPGFNELNGQLNADYTPGSVGGETAHQLTIAELASHTHGIPDADQNAGYGSNNFDTGGQSNIRGYPPTTATGGNRFHENRPLYYGLAFIMRIA